MEYRVRVDNKRLVKQCIETKITVSLDIIMVTTDGLIGLALIDRNNNHTGTCIES